MFASILVVDDDPQICSVVRDGLAKPGHTVEIAFSGAEGLAKFAASHPDVVFLDVSLGDKNGLEVLRAMLKQRKDVAIVVMSGQSSVSTAVEAIKAGAFHYITKPFLLSELEALLAKALEGLDLRREVQTLRREKERSIQQALSGMVGESRTLQEIKTVLAKVAASSAATVLIEGETGTGKEVAARTIHYLSGRRDHPFLVANCSVPEAQLEAELFGPVRSESGAAAPRQGLLHAAAGGTLFLDVVSDMPLAVQGKLLRILHDPVPAALTTGAEPSSGPRIIAATNRNLSESVAAGAFREDLFYRLQVMYVYLPPLRQHPEDIPLLARHFIAEFAAEFKRPAPELTPTNLDQLAHYAWPGNVRELRNCAARAMLLGQTAIEPGLERAERTRGHTTRILRRDAEAREREWVLRLPNPGVDEMEKELIRQVLTRCHNNKLIAAQMLGINRTTLYRKLAQYRLSDPNGGNPDGKQGKTTRAVRSAHPPHERPPSHPGT